MKTAEYVKEINRGRLLPPGLFGIEGLQGLLACRGDGVL